MLLLGGGVRGGKVYANWPGLAPAPLVDGDLAATTDYRSVIGEVLQKRCGFGVAGRGVPGRHSRPRSGWPSLPVHRSGGLIGWPAG